MEYVNLGKTGLKVSRLCLGMMSFGTPTWRDWVLPEAESRPFVKRALELGINFFDTADMYSLGSSEEVTGKLLGEMASRDELVVASKVYFPLKEGPNQGGLSRKHIMHSIDNTLRRLNMEYVDLYQIHRLDSDTPMEEILEALHDVVKAGKARYIGASSMYAWQFAKMLYLADKHGWTRFVSMQNHMNLVYREEEREMVPLCRDEGIGLIPWSPLARGFLAGNRKREIEAGPTPRSKSDDFAHDMYYTDTNFDIVERVIDLAQNHAVTPAQIALAWVLHQSDVTAPIIGVTKMQHLEQAVAATEINLSDEELTYLTELYQPQPVLGH
ncbi:aldo/keto reductase [Anaerolineales bacterium HSG24]|nr:aldo/keto reductase [Anaerolineales bacterium HSG24]